MATRSAAGIWIAAGLIWITAVAVGLAALMDYDARPGLAAHPPLAWPAGSQIVRASDRPTLLMLAHPRCDCTRASLDELAELLAHVHNRPQVFVVFIKPGRTGQEWDKTGLSERAAAIPGVTVLRDEQGVEARRFAVATSGQTMLYSADGRLLFSGGATAARGKRGESVGRSALLAFLNGEPAPVDTTPVFGCPLFGPGDHPAPSPTSGAHVHGQSN